MRERERARSERERERERELFFAANPYDYFLFFFSRHPPVPLEEGKKLPEQCDWTKVLGTGDI